MSAGRPALRVLAGTPDAGGASGAPRAAFCGHCGHAPGERDAEARICAACGMGVVLEAAAALAPAPGEPFLVVDASLCVCAVSEAATQRLGVSEPDVVHRPVLELLEPADLTGGPATLTAALLAAAEGVTRAVVRPAGTFGVRLRARIGPCGSPPATLIVLEPLGAARA